MRSSTAIIILAAGNSSRLGKPKQLLSYQGKSLLRRIAGEASVNPDHQVVVVLGFEAARMAEELRGCPAAYCVNPGWERGMAGSIRTGLKAALAANPALEHCIMAVCDQPYVQSEVFEALKTLQRCTGKGIVATGFAGTWGVPVLFLRKYFDELMALEGRKGAKKLIEKYPGDRAVAPFEHARFDIDTLDDYYQLDHQLVSVAEAGEIIDHFLPEPAVKKNVPLQEAAGYTLASDVIAALSIPAFAQSSMDGYAIRYAEKDRDLEISGEMPAGTATRKILGEGQAIRIFTGAPLPAGADTVVMQEKVRTSGQQTVRLNEDALQQPGENVRPEGSEVKKGALAMSAGTPLIPPALGYLAGIGRTHVDIYAAPRVALILTGSELTPPGRPLAFGEVYESNSFQLQAALRELGIKEIASHHVRDDEEQLRQVMSRSLADFDILILVGGVSVGDYDYVTKAASGCGVRQRFHRVRQKPGKPFFFGTYGEKLIFGLPGNPSSALTCFYLYLAPAMEKMMRQRGCKKEIKAKVSHDHAKKKGLTHFLKAHYNGTEVTPLHAQESYRMQSYAQANCLLVLEEGSEGCKAGDELRIHLLNGA